MIISRINTHNIGRNQSEKARKEIEQKFGLVRAEQQPQLLKQPIQPVNAQKALYGKSETKRSISNVVSAVLNQYKFSSLPEFNAALKQFNVVADRGKEGERMYKNRGLVYRLLDEGGNKIGVPIKASSFSCKPILDNLEKKFTANEAAKELLKQQIKNKLDACLQTSPQTMNNLVAALEQKQIYTVLRQNTEGRLYGITFVDNQHKVVFNGSDLGKAYSAASLQSRLANGNEKCLTPGDDKSINSSPMRQLLMVQQKHQDKIRESNVKAEGVLDILLSTKEQYDTTPASLLKKKKNKKKKKQISTT